MDKVLLDIMQDIKNKIYNIELQEKQLDGKELLAFQQQKIAYEDSLLIVAKYFNQN